MDIIDYLKPTRNLMELIRRRDWAAVRERTLSYPADTKYRSKSGNNSTSLHLACLYRCPIDTVELIIDANPCAILQCDTEGWTPLHVTLLYNGADKDIAALLIQRGGRLAVSAESRYIGSPLHVACRHGSPASVLKEILRVHPVMAARTNENGVKPAALIWCELSKQHPEFASMVRDQKIGPDDALVKSLFQRLSILIQAAAGRDVGREESEPTSLHEVVKYQKELGLTKFIPVVAQLYPEHLQRVDENGDLPLHTAVCHSAEKPPMIQPGFPSFIPTVDTVDILIENYPLAASIPNRQGQLPLHLALMEGKRTWTSGIQSLVKVSPESIAMRDCKTRLYPLQLAAMIENDSDDNDTQVLDTIYELLLSWPPIVQEQSAP